MAIFFPPHSQVPLVRTEVAEEHIIKNAHFVELFFTGWKKPVLSFSLPVKGTVADRRNKKMINNLFCLPHSATQVAAGCWAVVVICAMWGRQWKASLFFIEATKDHNDDTGKWKFPQLDADQSHCRRRHHQQQAKVVVKRTFVFWMEWSENVKERKGKSLKGF